MEGRNLVSWPAILGTLALVVLGLLALGWDVRGVDEFLESLPASYQRYLLLV